MIIVNTYTLYIRMNSYILFGKSTLIIYANFNTFTLFKKYR